jgi:hypothetical protein
MSRRATGLVGISALAIAVILVVALTTGAMTPPSAEPGPKPDPTTLAPAAPSVDPAVQSRADARRAAKAARAARTSLLFRQNGCWNGEAPAGVVPTHALVTLPGKEPALVAADVGFGIWIDGAAGQLHGFCP